MADGTDAALRAATDDIVQSAAPMIGIMSACNRGGDSTIPNLEAKYYDTSGQLISAVPVNYTPAIPDGCPASGGC